MKEEEYERIIGVIQIQTTQLRRENRTPKFILMHYNTKKGITDFLKNGIVGYNPNDGATTCFGIAVCGTFDCALENIIVV